MAHPTDPSDQQPPRRRRWHRRRLRESARVHNQPAGMIQALPANYADMTREQKLDWCGQLLDGLGAAMTADGPDAPGADGDRPTLVDVPWPAGEPVGGSDEPASPFEWVFACSGTLGSIVHGARKFWFNGEPRYFKPSGSIGKGTRWCSQAWLDAHPDGRGTLVRDSMFSYMSRHLTGRRASATVLIVDDDALGDAAAILAGSLADAMDDPGGLTEWSFAVARQPGRTRRGVWFDGPGRQPVAERLSREVGVDWQLSFRSGDFQDNGVGAPCTFTNAAGISTTEYGGLVLIENEPLPMELLALADAHGTSIAQARAEGIELTWPTTDNRSLEPDEDPADYPYLNADWTSDDH